MKHLKWGLMGVFAVMAACGPKSPQYEHKPGKAELVLKDIVTCEKSEAQQGTPPAEYVVEQTVPIYVSRQQVKRIGCDDEVISQKEEIINDSNQKVITMEPPRDLGHQVNYATIENLRTCGVLAYESKGLSGSRNLYTERPPNENVDPNSDYPNALVTLDGEVQFLADVTTTMRGFNIPVRDGMNMIKITYYGKCIKDRADRKPGERDVKGCQSAEVLKVALLKLKIKGSNHKADGVRLHKDCKQQKK